VAVRVSRTGGAPLGFVIGTFEISGLDVPVALTDE